MLDLEDLTVRLPARAADAILSIVGCKSRTLRRTLGAQLGAPAGAPGSLVAEPVLEGAYPWLVHPDGWGALTDIMQPESRSALQSAMGYRPYAHQVAAWARLCSTEPASVIVSSGTGSGKTECFLGALLDRLLKDSDGGRRALTGVRGLMVYPLNALINSQQERLSAWLSPFKGRLRYCLYNGLTEETVPEATRRKAPEQVLDRKALRESPPPLLVTNLTMLEYMLVRRQDAPILAKSRGLLDFIVLDEAHTYVGAQAAELALLLRRVALAFGRDPRTIRVVATSATLGTGDRGEQEQQLQAFLADLTGSDRSAVHVVLGERAALDLPTATEGAKATRSELTELSDEALWTRLAGIPELQAAARRVHREERVRWSDWRAVAGRVLAEDEGGPDAGARSLLTACARAKRPGGGEAFIPVRVHLFERTFSGLWACCDSACPERPRGEENDWSFGKVFADPRESCDACGSLVLEARICRACGAEMLTAEETDGSGDGVRRLRAPAPEEVDDDFALELDLPNSDEDGPTEDESTPGLRIPRWVMPEMAPGRFRLAVRRGTGEILNSATPDALVLATVDGNFHGGCPACGRPRDHGRPAVRPFRIGPPFILGSSVPVALGAVTRDQSADGMPFGGRKLITFTDARQGTARLSAKLQADAERAFVRAFVYHAVQVKPASGSAEEVDNKRKTVATLESLVAAKPELKDVLTRARGELAALEGSAEPQPVPWNDMRDRLAQDATLLHLKTLWADREEAFENPGDLAHFLVLREFLRRAVRGNSAETMGLARLVLPGQGEQVQPPSSARALGLSGGDWRDLLHLIVTHFLRLNTIVSVASGAFNWIDRRPTHIAVAQFEKRTSTEFPWPAVRSSSRPSRVVSLLAQASGVSLDDRGGCDLLNEALEDARQALQRYLEPTQGAGSRLNMRTLALGKVKDAWLCPVTRRVLDTTLKGLSPYPRNDRHPEAAAIRLPNLPAPFRPTKRACSRRLRRPRPSFARMPMFCVCGKSASGPNSTIAPPCSPHTSNPQSIPRSSRRGGFAPTKTCSRVERSTS